MKAKKEAAASSDELVDELHDLVSDAGGKLKEAAGEHAEEFMDNLHEQFGATQERLSELYDVAKKKSAAYAKSTDKMVRANPYQSIAIALGVGLVAGVLIGRRTK
jgi:ElaB/YqjD/DUF883 family membrane-anchored ribosome-binding protein